MGNNFIIVGNETLIDLRSDTVAASNLLLGYTAHDKRGASITGELTPVQSGTVGITSLSAANGTFVLNNIVGNPTNCLIVRSQNTAVNDGGKIVNIWKLGTETDLTHNGFGIMVSRNIPVGTTAGTVTITKNGTDLYIYWADASQNYIMYGNYVWVVW